MHNERTLVCVPLLRTPGSTDPLGDRSASSFFTVQLSISPHSNDSPVSLSVYLASFAAFLASSSSFPATTLSTPGPLPPAMWRSLFASASLPFVDFLANFLLTFSLLLLRFCPFSLDRGLARPDAARFPTAARRGCVTVPRRFRTPHGVLGQSTHTAPYDQ